MRAIEMPEYGPPEVARIVEAPEPQLRPGRVLLRVLAAAVNYSDVMIAGDFYPGHNPPTPPYIAGREACGIVEAIGEGVTGFSVGDRVVGLGLQGAFADLVLCHPATLSPAPAALSDAAAAGFMLQHLTALAAVRLGEVSAGDRILVHAAAGGVGQVATRIAARDGARVVATASTDEKRQLALEAGAEIAIDYTRPTWVGEVRAWSDGVGVDVAIDTVGGSIFTQTRDVMRPFGRLVLAGVASGDTASIDRTEMISTHCHALIPLELGSLIVNRRDLLGELRSDLDGLLATGAITVDEPTVHGLEDGPAVLTAMAGRETSGKHVLSIAAG